MLNSKFVTRLFVLGGLALYIYIAILVFKEAYGSTNPSLNSAVIYLYTSLTAMIGALIAASYALPAQSTIQPPISPVNDTPVLQVSYLLTSKKDDGIYKKWIGMVYSLVYLIIGLFGVFVWIKIGDKMPVVRDTAMTFLGMMMAIIKMYLSDNATEPEN